MKIKHGMNGTKLYRVWGHMKERCNYPKHKSYKNYGGKGVKVCDEWNKDFLPFYNWAINNGYDEKLTLDRIDPKGNYEPENCRWISAFEQQSNKSNNRYIEFKGMKKTASEWARIYNLDRHTIYYRLDKGVQGEDLFKKGRKAGGIGGNSK